MEVLEKIIDLLLNNGGTVVMAVLFVIFLIFDRKDRKDKDAEEKETKKLEREASNKKVLANQLGGVSKVISSLADDITEKEEEKEKEKQEYKLIVGSATATKNNSEISGDSSIKTKLSDGKYMIAISDGMGSRKSSQKK